MHEEVQELRNRVQRMERQIRLTRAASFTMTLCLLGLVTIRPALTQGGVLTSPAPLTRRGGEGSDGHSLRGASASSLAQRPRATVVRAPFRVVNRFGRVLMEVVEVPNGGRLDVYGPTGSAVVLSPRSERGDGQVITCFADGVGSQEAVRLAADDGGGFIHVRSRADRVVMAQDVIQNGSRLRLADDVEQDGFSELFSGNEGGSLQLHSRAGRSRVAAIGVDGTGTRGTMETWAEGSSSQASVFSDPDSSGRVLLRNNVGTPVFNVP